MSSRNDTIGILVNTWNGSYEFYKRGHWTNLHVLLWEKKPSSSLGVKAESGYFLLLSIAYNNWNILLRTWRDTPYLYVYFLLLMLLWDSTTLQPQPFLLSLIFWLDSFMYLSGWQMHFSFTLYYFLILIFIIELLYKAKLRIFVVRYCVTWLNIIEAVVLLTHSSNPCHPTSESTMQVTVKKKNSYYWVLGYFEKRSSSFHTARVNGSFRIGG